MTHPPAPGQQEIRVDRGNQLKLLRLARVGGTPYKAMLFALDSRIGREKGCWDMSYEELGDDIEVTESSAYRIASALHKAGLIGRVPMGRKRARFSIRWDTLWQQYGHLVQPHESKTAVIKSTNSVTESANEIREFNNSVREFENAPITSNKLTPPPPPPPSEPDRDAAMAAVREAGVELFVDAVDTAISQRMTIPQILAVVDFFRNQAGQWPPGVLFARLTVKGAYLLAPHKGWDGFRKNPGYRPPIAVEPVAQAPGRLAEVAARLDAMTDAERLELVTLASPRDRSFLASSIDGRKETGAWHSQAIEGFSQLMKRQRVEV